MKQIWISGFILILLCGMAACSPASPQATETVTPAPALTATETATPGATMTAQAKEAITPSPYPSPEPSPTPAVVLPSTEIHPVLVTGKDGAAVLKTMAEDNGISPERLQALVKTAKDGAPKNQRDISIEIGKGTDGVPYMLIDAGGQPLSGILNEKLLTPQELFANIDLVDHIKPISPPTNSDGVPVWVDFAIKGDHYVGLQNGEVVVEFTLDGNGGGTWNSVGVDGKLTPLPAFMGNEFAFFAPNAPRDAKGEFIFDNASAFPTLPNETSPKTVQAWTKYYDGYFYATYPDATTAPYPNSMGQWFTRTFYDTPEIQYGATLDKTKDQYAIIGAFNVSALSGDGGKSSLPMTVLVVLDKATAANPHPNILNVAILRKYSDKRVTQGKVNERDIPVIRGFSVSNLDNGVTNEGLQLSVVDMAKAAYDAGIITRDDVEGAKSWIESMSSNGSFTIRTPYPWLLFGQFGFYHD